MEYVGMELPEEPLSLPDVQAERKSDYNFMVDLVAAANELRKTLLISSSLIPQVELPSRNYAILTGLAVRTYKLFDTFGYLIADKRMETAMILARSACETAIDINYLCSPMVEEKFDRFVRSSMVPDKRIYDEIELDRKNGIGQTAIQDRIQTSILQGFKAAGLEINQLKYNESRSFGTTRYRAIEIGMEREYLFIFSNLSRMTHGSWSELCKYHLVKVDGLWYPEQKYRTPQPQILGGVSIMTAAAMRKYVETVIPESSMIDRICSIEDWFRQMEYEHERFLARDT